MVTGQPTFNNRTLRASALAVVIAAGNAFATGSAPAPRVEPSSITLAECQAAPDIDQRSSTWWNSAARLLAGMPMPDESPISDRQSVATHREQLSALWSKFDSKRLRPIHEFARRELSVGPVAAPVFYPFSGPDAAYALAFFPQASDFIFTGLEPVGGVPDLATLSDAVLAENLDQLRSSLRSVLALSFFVTMEMDTDLRRNKLSGVTPILLLFLARHGYTVNAVEPFMMAADQRLCRADARSVKNIRSQDERITGVIVRFQAVGEAQERRIVYLKTDLSNEGLQKRPQYLRFVESVNPPTTLIKSASYLLHLREFTVLRDHILKRSQIVLQDDTGVPLKLYSPDRWEQRLYGAYVGPIAMFSTRFQPEMKTAYQDAAHPLGFGIGYRYESHESNLQLFVRRTHKTIANVNGLTTLTD